jgi:transposase
MKFEEIYEMRTEKRLTTQEAAQLLGMCERNFRRYVQRYRDEGMTGLVDKRLGRQAHNAADAEEVQALVELYQQHYSGYTASHFFDKYQGKYYGKRSYNWVRLALQETGTLKTKKRRGPHRRQRPRTPMKGMMLHQDGSTHQWVEGMYWDLIVTLDDADNEIYSAFFVEEEGTWSSFQGVQEVIEQKGLFCSLYTDRGTHYWTTTHAGKKVDKNRPTQFRRAMQQLGIEMIAAYSPEARGRSERMFGTLQGRLPKELKSAGITTLDEANQFLRDTFLPEFNQRFKVKTQEEIEAFIPWSSSHLKLEDILCIQEQRTVNKDNTIHYQGKQWQIPKDPQRYSYAKAKVRVHEYIDGSMAIFHGPRKLVHFDNRSEKLPSKREKLNQSKSCGLREFMDNRFAVTHKPHKGPQVQQQQI